MERFHRILSDYYAYHYLYLIECNVKLNVFMKLNRDRLSFLLISVPRRKRKPTEEVDIQLDAKLDEISLFVCSNTQAITDVKVTGE